MDNNLLRVHEHLGEAIAALTHVGADGLNYFQLHIRLAIDWAYNWQITVKATQNQGLEALCKSVIALTNTPVQEIPETIKVIHSELGKVIPSVVR
ncbi:MAG: hypothetical protein KME46_29770 [Brasilonema angustatum HA4187-MV1]|jgi:hypothetical protein|nr:hypothetical protein [Brasilonema angustatum HA4187-MV1]